MKLNDWIDKQDGIDDVLADDINEIAHAVQENSSDIEETNSVLLIKADKSELPQKVSELENDSGYITAEALENKADKPSWRIIEDGETVTLADNTNYYVVGAISNLTINYPSENFICSLEFTLASTGDITITLPKSKYIGGAPTFANGETWELNIKNGVVVGGLIE